MNKIVLRNASKVKGDGAFCKSYIKFNLNKYENKINFETKLNFSTNKRNEENPLKKKKSIFLTWKCFAFNLGLCIPTLYLYKLQCDKKHGGKNHIGKTRVENIGKPLIGGNFTLIDYNGNIVTNQTFKGKYCLIYFGFSYCPDICPQELEKQTIVFEKISKKYGDIVTPIFITVDPNRDTVAQINYYCKSFNPKLIGLTGTKDLIKHVAKLFRVYYNEHITDMGNTNQTVTNQNKYNYLIDHSIIHYLLDTEGKFVDFFGKNCTINEMVDRISQYLDEHIASQKKLQKN
ncbi:Cg3 protein, putative [Plasmodium chabaudi chabaudi]|uniref:Cg3 protein, putative n=1 Tax=Plasmodium chabaudi chabaudi TaxID=31271 RepID=A0A1D3S0Y7_PLACU|nr:Cg3 protein, putative [Plasmodium chabaudi chabaudi]